MSGINQMSRQMGISKGKASSLMKKAKKMNGYQGGGSAAAPVSVNIPGSGMSRISSARPMHSREGSFRSMGMGYASGGMARVKGTPPAQVKGFTYNDNGGEGTF